MTPTPDPVLDRVLDWSLDQSLPLPCRYLAVTLLVVAVALVRVLFVTSMVPWLLFVPGILAAALIFGQRLGVYASLLSTIAAALTIGDPARPWFLTQPQLAGSLLFLVITLLLARMVGGLRLMFHRARRLNVELTERQAFLSSVLASSTDRIEVIGLDGRLTFMSAGGLKVLEIADFDLVRGRIWADGWEDQSRLDARDAIDAARQGRASHFLGSAPTLAGTPKWWDVSVTPILAEGGGPDRILSVARDMTALIAAQEQQRLLNAELGHRLKNVLTLVQSIAGQTFRQSRSIAEADAAFASRLSALGKASDVLTATAWQTATLDDVVEAGLASIGGCGDRVTVDGPPIRLDAQVALALTLALHELTTNACKYGALSGDRGTVSLRWDQAPVAGSSDTRFTLLWQEEGGPPVAPPTHRGFGSRLIERSLRTYFQGEIALSFAPHGVAFRIDARLPEIAALPG